MSRIVAAVRALAGEDLRAAADALAVRVGELEEALDDREAEVAALRADSAALAGSLARVKRDRSALRQAVRELRERVEARDQALWAAALCAARPGVTLPDPGELDPDDVVALVATSLHGRAPS